MASTQTSSPAKSRFTFGGPKKDTPRKPKSALREWLDSIIFAVVVASLVHWLIMQPFTIPTSSMEKSLLVGDYLFVSKFHYGARVPRTLLQVPLTHQTIWGTSIPSYLDWIYLPYMRLPGISRIKNNDVVVFNYPSELQYPSDLKTNYIKRCVGIAGDSIRVADQQVYINGKPAKNPEEMQHLYKMVTNTSVQDRVFQKYGIRTFTTAYNPNTERNERIPEVIQENDGYVFHATAATAARLKEQTFVKDMVLRKTEAGVREDRVVQPRSAKWNHDNFGPLYIPKKGDRITLTADNLPVYQIAIINYEDNENVKVENDKLYIDGKEVTEYTFKQNYYFMMGDNRHNSEDSRYWGFVPEDHVVGKALFVWWSVASEGDGANWPDITEKIRWNRLFRGIE